MAVRALAGEADTVDAWFIEEARADPDSLQAWALANGAVSKQKIAPGYELEGHVCGGIPSAIPSLQPARTAESSSSSLCGRCSM